MRILLLGGTGFIGRHLISHLGRLGHDLVVLSRRSRPEMEQKNVSVLIGDPLQPGPWQEEASGCQVIMNLVGRNIMARWTTAVKKEIRESRLQSTRMAVQAVEKAGLNMAPEDKPVLINANAVGYYPFSESENQVFDETGPAGDHFLARVCADWQEEAMRATSLGARVVVARFAPVLAAGEGMLQLVLPVFRKGIGGRIGSGRQPFPWVHIQDLVRALELAVNDTSIQGPMNVCSPHIITNAQFTQALAQAVNRPAVLPVPEFALRLRFGELASMLSKGQAVKPAVLLSRDFAFIYADITQALQDIVSKNQ
ncbi:MAG: TIGR01777 family oxidoreductase [Desulfovermiculus sp.]|nr:TIGR01777 family oxidoreductase [Desulfovermiculus sp.]